MDSSAATNSSRGGQRTKLVTTPQPKLPSIGFTNTVTYLLTALAVVFLLIYGWNRTSAVELDYSDFKTALLAKQIKEVVVAPGYITGSGSLLSPESPLAEKLRKTLPRADSTVAVRFTTVRVEDSHLIEDLERGGAHYAGTTGQGWMMTLLSWIVPTALFVGFWMFVMRRSGAQGVGGDLIGIGKSKARLFVQKNIGVTFADVEGIDEAKGELMEVVEFLRHPERYRRLGGRIPKGILIVGAPGTGKTLLAKAVAGEANVPFLSISGSEFVEMFVGVGAARVRDLFQQAERLAPSIIFIDELDALGKARGVGINSHEEREQTLNQLLVEMDGFDTNKGVIIMAATNRPEILDTALLRPGRFDRHVAIDRPDILGRERILKLHANRLILDPKVDLKSVAARTPGFAGADLANIVNEAALHAARHNKQTVDTSDFDAAIDRAIAGSEKKNRVMNANEKRTVAYHEAGHAIIAELRTTTDKVAKVSIIPRGIGALGFTQQLPTEDRYLLKRSELLDRLDVLLGGRVTEQLIFGEPSTGAQNDLQRATDLARHMVAQYGMSETLGGAVLDVPSGSTYLDGFGMETQHLYSERTARQIDAEVHRLLQEAEVRVTVTLHERHAELEALAKLLLEHETVDRAMLVALLARKHALTVVERPTASTTTHPIAAMIPEHS